MVNYPHKKKATLTSEKTISFGKRGMSFEDDLAKSNEHYLATNKAVIPKNQHPVQIVKVHYLNVQCCHHRGLLPHPIND